MNTIFGRKTAFEGWSEFPELAGVMLEFCQINANKPGGLSFLAELDGQAIATEP